MTTASGTALPIGDGSRNGAAYSGGTTTCPVCERSLPSMRAVYCSAVCRQRAFRLRRVALVVVDDAPLRAELRRHRALVAHTLYECSGCGERLLGERRCPECNLFCQAVGLGGRCIECDQPISLAELLGLEVVP